MENPIRSQFSSINAKYEPDIIEAALNAILETLKFAAHIGSTTVENEACRLFYMQAREAWASVASTNDIQKHRTGIVRRGAGFEVIC